MSSLECPQAPQWQNVQHWAHALPRPSTPLTFPASLMQPHLRHRPPYQKPGSHAFCLTPDPILPYPTSVQSYRLNDVSLVHPFLPILPHVDDCNSVFAGSPLPLLLPPTAPPHCCPSAVLKMQARTRCSQLSNNPKSGLALAHFSSYTVLPPAPDPFFPTHSQALAMLFFHSRNFSLLPY